MAGPLLGHSDPRLHRSLVALAAWRQALSGTRFHGSFDPLSLGGGDSFDIENGEGHGETDFSWRAAGEVVACHIALW